MTQRIFWGAACALAALLAGCQSGSVSREQKQALAQMTPQQRDQIGRQAVQRLRKSQMQDRGDVRMRDIRYRAADDTLVLDMQFRQYLPIDRVDARQRRTMERKITRELRQRTCRDADMKSVMVHGRYALEYHIRLNNGKALMPPVRVTAAHC